MNLALSLFLGGLGIDRMVNGCVKQGFEKLLVGWIPLVGLPIQGLWWLTDVGTAALSKDGYIGCRKDKARGQKTGKPGRFSRGWSTLKSKFRRKPKQEGGRRTRRRRKHRRRTRVKKRRRRTRVKKRRRRRKTRRRRG